VHTTYRIGIETKPIAKLTWTIKKSSWTQLCTVLSSLAHLLHDTYDVFAEYIPEVKHIAEAIVRHKRISYDP
jgi:hypothetical protein